jgi:hypothetical protein
MTKKEELFLMTEAKNWWYRYYSSTRGSHIPTWDSLCDRIFHAKQLRDITYTDGAQKATNDILQNMYKVEQI